MVLSLQSETVELEVLLNQAQRLRTTQKYTGKGKQEALQVLQVLQVPVLRTLVLELMQLVWTLVLKLTQQLVLTPPPPLCQPRTPLLVWEQTVTSFIRTAWLQSAGFTANRMWCLPAPLGRQRVSGWHSARGGVFGKCCATLTTPCTPTTTTCRSGLGCRTPECVRF